MIMVVFKNINKKDLDWVCSADFAERNFGLGDLAVRALYCADFRTVHIFGSSKALRNA